MPYGLGDPGAADHPAHDPGSAVPVQLLPTGSEENRPFTALADRQVNHPGSPWRQRDSHNLATHAGDGQRTVTPFDAQRLDARAGRL